VIAVHGHSIKREQGEQGIFVVGVVLLLRESTISVKTPSSRRDDERLLLLLLLC
jgi:hypothetical protein